MKYEEIFPVLDEMFEAESGTAFDYIDPCLRTGHSGYYNTKNSVRVTGDSWDVVRTGNATAVVVRRDHSNSGIGRAVDTRDDSRCNLSCGFRAIIYVKVGRCLDKSLLPEGQPPTPEDLRKAMREKVCFQVIR